MRVLMITTEWPRVPWGTAQFIARQATFLRAAGVDLEVFAFQGNANPLNYAAAWFQVRRRLAREHFDLVHAQFGQCALMALPKRVPMVLTFRGDDLQGIPGVRSGRVTLAGRLLRSFCRWSAHRADAVILVSAHMQRYLRNGNGTPVHVVPSGLDFELFRPMPQAPARARLGLPHDERLVLFVGNPDLARKRYALARDAVALLPASPRTRLVVGWHVPHEQIPDYMAACDAPVPVGDVAERLNGIEGCELCADDRPETIAAALERVLARGERVASRAAVSHLDERLITQRVIAIYNGALNGRPRA